HRLLALAPGQNRIRGAQGEVERANSLICRSMDMWTALRSIPSSRICSYSGGQRLKQLAAIGPDIAKSILEVHGPAVAGGQFAQIVEADRDREKDGVARWR